MAKPNSIATNIAVSLFALLFAVAFTAGGILGGIYPLYGQATNWWAARSYVPVQATVETAQLEHHPGRKGGGTDLAKATFNYQFEGRSYHGGRASFSAAADNVGDYQEALYEHLQAARSACRPVTLWVDPRHPESAVFDRGTRWQMSLLHLPFAVLFTAVGLGAWVVAIGVWCIGRGKSMAASLAAGTHPKVRAKGSGALWMTLFALFWNVMAWPIGLLALDDFLTGRNALAVLAMIFPAVGIGCAYLAWHWWRSQRPAGRPVAEITGIGPLRGRIHFHPPLGGRDPQQPALHAVKLDAALVQQTGGQKKGRTVTLWRQQLMHGSLPGGLTHLDFQVETPPEQEDSHLQLLLAIAGVDVVFDLPATHPHV